LTVSLDSSAALETRIEQGAQADVFLSADMTNPERLAAAGLAGGRPVPFAGNELTIIVPSGNPAGIRSPADLAHTGVKVIAAGDGVPITRYASSAVDRLSSQPGYPADFAARYRANVASREDNVAAVVSKIELGEGDAAMVYATDAKASSRVAVVDLPPAANVRATYAGVVLRDSSHATAASALLEWLAGPAGQAILAPLGFLPPSP
jgi:molybdate transport system substrate-binding protein